MAKIKPIETIKTYGVSAGSLTIAAYCYLYYGVLPWPVVFGFGLPAGVVGLASARRLYNMIAPSTPRGRVIPLKANGREQNGLMMSTEKLIPFLNKENPGEKRSFFHRNEFIFQEQWLESDIPESQLFGFCKAAWRRQQRHLLTVPREDGAGIKSNQILSEKYFTSRSSAGNNFVPAADYRSIINILRSSGLIINRWKGGKLLYTPHVTVEEAKNRFS